MFIEEVILEGFKSYANRTVISGWDKDFNAITGLNGTGKSNILDAICFVLGIDNLRQVRASTLQDLVYKRGQTGITKATVSIVFNNQDKLKSPLGYADSPKITVTRQIIIGGKNKYLINGHVVLQKNVESLFHSVQLNINNPHFLIMQGQITKVLNMKSAEILALVEEAAGTRMYEERKDKALVAMDKKEKKVEEITKLLNHVIQPKLEKLKSQRAHFFEYQRMQTDLEKLKAIIDEFEYVEVESNLSQNQQERETAESCLLELNESVKSIKEQIAHMQQQIQKQMKELEGKEKIVELEKQIAKKSNERTRFSTLNENLKKSRKQEEERLQQLNEKISKNAKIHREKLEEEDRISISLEDDKSKHEQISKRVKASSSQELTQLSIENSIEEIRSSIQKSKDNIAKLAAKVSQTKKKSVNLKSIEKDIASEEDFLSQNKTQIESIQGLSIEKESLTAQKEQLSESVSQLENSLSKLKNAFYGLEFFYQVPHKSFDKGLVHGSLASLVSIKDTKYSGALSIVAGGRLYSVVVENEHVANQLMESNKFRGRTTFIPLNKIIPSTIPKSKIDLARTSYTGFVELASHLLDFDKKFQPAVEHVFGKCFVCSNQDTARKIAFELKCKAITLDGDIYHPGGSLTGGSRKNDSKMLGKSDSNSPFQYRTLYEALQEDKEKLHSIDNSLSEVSFQIDSLQSLKQELAEKQRNIVNLKNELAEIIEDAEHRENNQKLLTAEKERLQVKEAELLQISKSSIQDILKHDREEIVRLEKSITKNTSLLQKIQVERKQFENDISEYKKELENCQNEIAQNESTIEENLKILSTFKNALLQLQRSYDNEKLKFEESEKQLYSLKDTLSELKRTFAESESSIIKYHKLIEDLNSSAKSLSGRFKQMQKPKSLRNPPISNADYNEARVKIASISKQLVQVPIDSHEKGIMEMIDSLEKKEKTLVEMLQIVVKDKSKISQTLSKLNKYKKKTLSATISKVDADFCEIFSKILPGNAAVRFQKVYPPSSNNEEEDIEGLEIKVSLDGAKSWKNSLTELSGGQRSLVALSLILSLLKYSPAPMYILDEIDAALDLSHTQNIGLLLKSGMFHGSQFIIVSLKEGMFSNANMLFKTKFKDGISSIDRMSSNK